MQTDSIPQIQSEVWVTFSEKLAKMAFGITQSIYNYNQFSLYWRWSHCGCANAQNLGISELQETLDKGLPALYLLRAPPLSRTLQDRLQLDSSSCKTISEADPPLPSPHVLPSRRVFSCGLLLEPPRVHSIPLPIAIPWCYLNKVILCLLRILFSILHNNHALRMWRTVLSR